MATNILNLLGLGQPRLLAKVGASDGGAPEIPADARQGLAALSDAAAVLPPVSAAPQVVNPLEQGIERQTALVGRDLTAPKTWQELGGGGKVGRVLGTIGDVAGSMFAPAAMMMIPGTTLNRAMTARRDMGALEKLTGLQNEAQGQARAGEELGLQAQQGSRAERTLQAQLAENGLQMDAQGQISPLPPQQWSPKLRAEILPKTPEEQFIRENPTATAAQMQQFGQRPLSPQQASALNQMWNGIATQYHLPQDQFREGMAAADAAALSTGMNNVISRGQGAQKIVVEAGQQGNARADKSYQYNNGELDKLSTPITQLRQRMGNLQTSLGQNTTQSLSFVAPEMLSVLAGGQGSGLRMNEAEISRIVGGRSNWEGLRGNLQTWSTDPAHASPLPAVQVAQMQRLANAVNARIQAKADALDDAYGRLLETDDIKQHRAIVSETRGRLNDIDDHGVYKGQVIQGKGTVIGFNADGTLKPVQVDDGR